MILINIKNDETASVYGDSDDRLATIPVVGELLHEIIQPRERVILLGGLGHGKEDLSRQRSRKPSY